MSNPLFELMNGVVVPSVHCETLKTLHNIKRNHPEDFLKIYQYYFYMCCPDPDINPYFHSPEYEKEDLILSEIEAEFSIDEEDIATGLEWTRDMYSTETSRAYEGIKVALDNIAKYMKDTAISDGKEGNIGQIRAMAKDYDAIRQSFKNTFRDLKEEQTSKVRGNKDLGYDQND